MFTEFLRIFELEVRIGTKYFTSFMEKIEIVDFIEILTSCGYRLKSIKIEIFGACSKFLNVLIEDDHFLVIGQMELCDFLGNIANICTKIQCFSLIIWISPASGLLTIDSISKLIKRNKEMRCFTLLGSGLELRLAVKDLPESIENVKINLLAKECPAICKVS